MPNPNLELLELAAERLRQFLPEIVFVGGCATGLLIDAPAAAPVRGIYDVDVIAEIGSYAEYAVFSDRRRALGFKAHSRTRMNKVLPPQPYCDLRLVVCDPE